MKPAWAVLIYLQTFRNMKALIGFCVTVQTYWWLKVDGSHIILSGDVAPLQLALGKTLSMYNDTVASCLCIIFLLDGLLDRCTHT